MSTESKCDAAGDVEAETELDEPIKIRWTGDARTKLITRYFEPAQADGAEPDSVTKMFNRQKTNVVIESEEELNALRRGLDSLINTRSPKWTVWMTGAHMRAYKRVRNELPEKAPTIEPGATVETDEWGEVTVESESHDGVYENVRIDTGEKTAIVHKDTLEKELL